MNERFDVIVVGEGVAGLTLAGLLARRGKRVASFEAGMFGGLVINVNKLDPAPSGRMTSGAELVAGLLGTNMELGVRRFDEEVGALCRSDLDSAHIVVGSVSQVEAPHVVIASGARWKMLGVSGEIAFEGRGVSHCADCDGRLFLGKCVAVVGGGDSALQEALVLAEYCSVVHLLVRGLAFTAHDRFVEAIGHKHNIVPNFNVEVDEIYGTGSVQGVIVRSQGEKTPRNIACDGIFPFIGLVANTHFLSRATELDSEGRVITDARLATTVAGIWAIGAVRAGNDGLLSGAIADAECVLPHIVS